MDLSQTIAELYAQRDKLAHALALLEDLEHGSVSSGLMGGKKRGRKSMPPHEREEVSRRMKRYWAKQRKMRQSETA